MGLTLNEPCTHWPPKLSICSLPLEKCQPGLLRPTETSPGTHRTYLWESLFSSFIKSGCNQYPCARAMPWAGHLPDRGRNR